ncbi:MULTISPECIES: ion channel [Chromobacterium]|uniref:Ion channel n=1 Tax=Chromobacterium aquaticum TaxID=467180 RepID=A0ABV8ZYY4_9NEIS|nr:MULTISPECIES: ion channel [Chromobacterium]KMN31158.1 potassium channel protein [Chromobacterium sp. LK1]MCD5363799.1 ion channel [Chromobacterium aquaticum]
MTTSGNKPARRVEVGGRSVYLHSVPRHSLHDLYHFCMTISWPRFYLFIAAAFIALNLLFAGLYQAQAGGIANQYPQGFLGAFFFSVETLATVGYGDMHPQSLYTHWISMLEIFIGMMSIALITGVSFARFSRPRARIVFTHSPVVRMLNGEPALMLRAANARNNVIIDASARLRLLQDEVSAEGVSFRKLHDLALVREQHPMFVLGWTLVHKLDEASPLYERDAESLAAVRAQLILSINGIDETTVQPMVARHTFSHQDIRWNHAFADLIYTDAEENDHVDYQKLQEVRPLSPDSGRFGED